MSFEEVEALARAVLYEGYMLYPYRPSAIKNQLRWTFGGVYPRSYCEASGAEAWQMQAQCLVMGDPETTTLAARVRFLHLMARTVGAVEPGADSISDLAEGAWRPLDALELDGKVHRSWQEAVERAVDSVPASLGELAQRPQLGEISFPATRTVEPLQDAEGRIAGVLVRQQEAVRGQVSLSAELIDSGTWRVTLLVSNQAPPVPGTAPSRDAALLRTLVSAHAILSLEGGRFVSLTDPPPGLEAHANACRNIGVWPVLAGPEGSSNTMLASPIILEDHARIAEESPGDLFDGTEIDEILSLRILTLTDAEKAEMRGGDERARAILERTEALSGEQLMSLHGTVRSLRQIEAEQ